MGQLEIDMESALRPRDIQARIRAGESLEAVAQAAGVPIAKIEPFAAPVIAERDHIAGLAQTNPVRRAGTPWRTAACAAWSRTGCSPRGST